MKFEIISMMPNIEGRFHKDVFDLPDKLINTYDLNNKPSIDSFELLTKQIKAINSLGLSSHEMNFIEELYHIIHDNFQNSYFQRPQLAAKIFISERQLYRKVMYLIQKKPMDLLRDFRLLNAVSRLQNGQRITQVGYDCGFNSNSYFSMCFKKKYGITPKLFQTRSAIN